MRWLRVSCDALDLSRETARRFLVIVAFAFWVGGFFFYASVVVETGAAVLGSSTAQGFITQRVTGWLNVSSVPALLIFLWNGIASRGTPRREAFRTLAVTWIAIVAIQAALFALHPVLDRMLVPADERVLSPRRFHRLHSLYLDLSSVQQFTAILHLWMAMAIWRQAYLKPYRAE